MTDASAARTRLIEIVTARSFSQGSETRLVSGRCTNFYFNMKPAMLHPESAHLIALLTLEVVKGTRVDYVGGLEIGAVPLATAVAVLSHVRGRPIGAFFLEDVTTTGGSSMKAIAAVQAQGAIIEGVITVVDRLEGAAEAFKAAGIPFHALLTADDFR
jgi:orotate phosphoribosyltransferase